MLKYAGWLSAGSAAVAGLGLLALAVGRSADPLDTGDKVASVVGGTLAVPSLVVAVVSLVIALRQHRRPSASADQRLESLGRARGLLSPEPLSRRGGPVAHLQEHLAGKQQR